ncbi:MAG: hypothetical protein IH594_14720, partial [Bacteroidales bacterium]|nr:hypothetical protein [Bacteroidales bacterium]
GLVTDAFLLMNHADLKLYVTRLGHSRKKAFRAIMEDIEQKKIENLYLMINSDTEDKMGYSGYSYKEEKKKKGRKGRKKTVGSKPAAKV